ncbi:MAG: carboxymuconolactone decarboxylase family protein [Nocardioides sp.]|uniref:carboxymuconolactone decarboxylase family protein n=1 Tax=Nocardioides sp. TaxID=35761 RepID=UPI0039E53EC8
MPRVPEVSPQGEVADQIRLRRPGGILRPIDRVLLHSPRLAAGWNQLLGAIRTQTDLRPDLRELIILRIAVLNGAAYEWDSHLADAAAAGIDERHLAALRAEELDSAAFDDLQLAVLRLTDRLTREVAVDDDAFSTLADELGAARLVELVTTVAAYNMVSRLVVGLGVESEAVR